MSEASNDSISEVKLFKLDKQHWVIKHFIFFTSSSANAAFGMEQMGNFKREADEEENA